MHDEVLSPEQKKLLPLLKIFSSHFGLIGGTAVALQLGHRRSIDFDLATHSELKTLKIGDKIRGKYDIGAVIVDETNEYTLIVNNVKITFLRYPFTFRKTVDLEGYIEMPDLLTLGSMKAYTLGRRAKWKDYVDLYFIIDKYSLEEVVGTAKEIFKNEFNEKLFREQLAYHKDIDYSEEIDYLKNKKVDDEIIKEKLTEFSIAKGK